MKKIAIGNEKGGIGKTTISTQLALYLFKEGYKVAFVDANAQGNSSRYLNPHISNTTAIDFFTNSISHSVDNDFLLLNATRKLLGINDIKKDVLQRNIDFLKNRNYDYLVFDTSNELSQCTISCVMLSDYIFAPVNFSDFAFDGVARTLDVIKQVREDTGSDVILSGIIPNMVNTKTAVQMKALNDLLIAHPGMVLPFLAHRAPYTDVMNGHIPLWDMKPMAGNVKTANHELLRLLKAMVEKINEKEASYA